MKIESQIKEIAASQESVYDKLSNLSNLETVVNKMKEPGAREALKDKLSESEIDSVMEKLDSLRFDNDSLTVNLPMLGDVGMRVAERKPAEKIVLESVDSMVGFKILININPDNSDTSRLSLAVDANINPFMGAMVSKPLKEGIEKIADLLAKIHY